MRLTSSNLAHFFTPPGQGRPLPRWRFATPPNSVGFAGPAVRGQRHRLWPQGTNGADGGPGQLPRRGAARRAGITV
jgi:hypothetical protein